MNTEELLANWIKENGTFLNQKNILTIRRAQPRFQTRNFFSRFKIETAKLDGTGENPTEITCFVLEISETDQSALIAPDTKCDSIRDL